MHKLSYKHMKRFVDNYLPSRHKLSVLDVGSMDVNGSYKPLFVERNCSYTGVDIEEGQNVDMVVDVGHFQMSVGEYDVVVSGQCLEHTKYPWDVVGEMAFVTKPGGLVCIIVPGSGPEHRFPIDCYRFFPDGMRALAEYAGLEVLECYSCWDEPGEDDEGNQWKDTVLIAKKPNIL